MSEPVVGKIEQLTTRPAVGASELKAMLGSTDAAFAAALLSLLKDNPWPSSDPAWEGIEIWAKDILRRLNVRPNDRSAPPVKPVGTSE